MFTSKLMEKVSLVVCTVRQITCFCESRQFLARFSNKVPEPLVKAKSLPCGTIGQPKGDPAQFVCMSCMLCMYNKCVRAGTFLE